MNNEHESRKEWAIQYSKRLGSKTAGIEFFAVHTCNLIELGNAFHGGTSDRNNRVVYSTGRYVRARIKRQSLTHKYKAVRIYS
jgi:hypothetical protein